MPSDEILRLRVTLKGRPVRTYTFNQEQVTIGRDPDADVFLDNPGISREHLRLEANGDGTYQVVDLGSANGTLLNEVPVVKQRVENNDVLRIGKYSLWVTYEEDRRGRHADGASVATGTDEGTTVLSFTELQGMIENARRSEAQAGLGPDLKAIPGGPGAGHAPQAWWGGRRFALVAFALGALVGAAAATAVCLGLQFKP